MSSERKGPRVERRSDAPPDQLRREREDFLKTFFRTGAKITEELLKEQESSREKLLDLEAENARLRAQIASDTAIRDLLTKIEHLESEKDKVLARAKRAEDNETSVQANYGEIESELANLANLYVASYQLHSSLNPRGVMRHIKELLAQLIGAEVFAIFLADEAGESLVPVANQGFGAGELGPIPVGQGVIGKAYADDRDYTSNENTRTGTLEAPAACIVLRLTERVLGVIAIVRTLEQKQAFIRVDKELFNLLGAQAMSALVAARLYTDAGGQVPALPSFANLGI